MVKLCSYNLINVQAELIWNENNNSDPILFSCQRVMFNSLYAVSNGGLENILNKLSNCNCWVSVGGFHADLCKIMGNFVNQWSRARLKISKAIFT